MVIYTAFFNYTANRIEYDTTSFFMQLNEHCTHKESPPKIAVAWKHLAKAKHHIYLGRFHASLASLEKAARIFNRYGYYEGKAHVDLMYSVIPLFNGQLAGLKPKLCKLLRYFNEHQDTVGLCETKMCLGHYYLACGEIPKAQSFLLQARDIAEKNRFHVYTIFILRDLANTYKLLGSIQEANRFAVESLKKAYHINDKHLQAWSIKTLADIDYAYALYDTAEKKYNQAKALFTAVKDSYGEALSLLSLGKIDIKFGQYARAHINLEQSLAIFQKLPDHNGILMVECQKCNLLSCTDTYTKAINAFQNHFSTMMVLNNTFEVTDFLLSFGRLHLDMGNAPAALTLFTRGLGIAEDNGLLLMECKFHFFMAKAKKRLLKFNEERDHYNRALAIAEHIGFTTYYCKTLCAIANIEKERKNTAEARKILTTVKNKIEKQQNNALLGSVLCSLATVDIALGDIASAERYLHQSLEIHQKRPKHFDELRTRFWLGKLNKIKGQHESSLMHFDYIINNLPLQKHEKYKGNVEIEKGLILLYMGQNARAKELFESALLAAKIHGDTLIIARAFYGLARVERREGRYLLFHAYIKQALESFDAINHYGGRADCLLAIAYTKTESGDVTESIHVLNDLKYRINDNIKKVDLLTHLAHHHYLAGAYHEALEVAEIALSHATKVLYPRGQCLALSYLGYAHLHLGSLTISLDFFDKAEAVAHTLGDPIVLGNILLGKSKAYIEKGLYGPARTAAQMALSFYRASRYILRSIKAKRLLHDIDALQLATIVPLLVLQPDIDFCDAQQLNLEKANIYTSMSTAFMLSSDFPKAREALQRALSLYQTKKLEVREANTLMKLAHIDILEGCFLTAEQRLQKADAVFLHHRIHIKSQLVHAELGTLYFHRGKMEQALQVYSDVLEHLNHDDHTYKRAEITVLKGNVYAAQQHFEKAKEAYLSACKTFKTVEDSLSLAYTLCNIADIEKKEGNPQQAISTYRQALSIALFLKHTQLIQTIKTHITKLRYATAPLPHPPATKS